MEKLFKMFVGQESCGNIAVLKTGCGYATGAKQQQNIHLKTNVFILMSRKTNFTSDGLLIIDSASKSSPPPVSVLASFPTADKDQEFSFSFLEHQMDLKAFPELPWLGYPCNVIYETPAVEANGIHFPCAFGEALFSGLAYT